jgi:hypothetical protein
MSELYRVKHFGGVVIESRASGERDGSLIPKGTILRPSFFGNSADLDRLISAGLIERIALTTEQPVPSSHTREPDPEVIPVLPTGRAGRARYRVGSHPVVPVVTGSNDETPVTAGKTLPVNLDPEWAELAVARGLISEIHPKPREASS